MKDYKALRREDLEKMSSEQLDAILRNELDGDTPDSETVLSVLSILEERDPTDSTNRPVGAYDDWEHIRNNRQGSIEDTVPESKRTAKPRKWIGAIAAVVAIVLVLAMTIPQTVGAESIFDIIGRWTKDLFDFSDSGTEQTDQDTYVFQTDHEGLQQLHDAVVELGVTAPVVPTWIPDGYELKELKIVAQSKIPKVCARFMMQDQYIQIMIECHSEAATNKYPKDDISVELCEYNGTSYYISSNEDTQKAMWTNENAECSVTTNDDTDIIKKILNSI